WKSSTDIFRIPLGIMKAGNLNLAGISSNGVVIHAGAGIEFRGHILPTTVALVLLDRNTGKVIYGAEGREESISAMSSSSDGAIYLAHSPIRRAVAHAFSGRITNPVIGGIGKYEPVRLDLLTRDASCAAKYRAENMFNFLSEMPESAIKRDFSNIKALVSQALVSAEKAFSDGDLKADQKSEFEKNLSNLEIHYNRDGLPLIMERLSKACEIID
ncbi:MAG: hypothetical protein HQK54_16045, partial [Oligoflexales bacterium]|nr:hypothetical protein [Oligoflexales bacterium]